jgi:hypothetical protein
MACMLSYRFRIEGDLSAPKETTAILPDSDSAWDYGETIIRGLIRSDGDADESRVMIIFEGDRIIASIAFNLAALRVPRSLQ